MSETWTQDAAGLQCTTGDNRAKIEFRYHAPAEYRYRVTFRRNSGSAGFAKTITWDGRQLGVTFGALNNKFIGFSVARGPDVNRQHAATKPGGWITNGQRDVTDVVVQHDHVQVYLDGQLVTSCPATAELHPVQHKQLNAWGLYDLLNTVYPWCGDSNGDYTD